MPIWVARQLGQMRITEAGVTEWTHIGSPFSVTNYAVAVSPGEKSVFAHERSGDLTHRARGPDGTSLWTGDHGAALYAVALDSSGNAYIGGERDGAGYNYRKLDADGSIVHSIDLGSLAVVNALSARHDYVYTGQSNFFVRQRRMDNGQAANWNYNHGAAVTALVEDAAGNIYLGGDRFSDISVRKIDSDGDLVWSFDTGGNVLALAIDEVNERLYAVGARVGSSATAWKLDLDGNEITTGWPTDHGTTLRAVAVDKDGNVYVGGSAISSVTLRKYLANGTEVTTGNWPLTVTGPVYGLAYLELLQAEPPGLPLPFALGAPIWAYTHSPAGLLLPVGLGLPELSTPPMPPAPDPALRAVYRLYLSEAGGSDLLELPLAALECRRRANESTWLALTVPAVTEARLAAIVERLQGEAVIYAGVATPSGETLGEFLRATLTEIAADRDESASGATLTARVIPTPFAAGSYTLQSVSERGADGGRRTVTCAVDPRIRPNDTVDDGNSSWTAGIITYRIDPTTAAMRITEKL